MKRVWYLLLTFLLSSLLLVLFFGVSRSQPKGGGADGAQPTPFAESAGSFVALVTTSHTLVPVGQVISVTATFYNRTDDVCFGLPLFDMHVNSSPPNPPVFIPVNKQSDVFYLMLYPGDSLQATLTSTASYAGAATFSVLVSGEGSVWDGNLCVPPYYWTAGGGMSESVTVFQPLGTAFFLPTVFGDLNPKVPITRNSKNGRKALPRQRKARVCP